MVYLYFRNYCRNGWFSHDDGSLSTYVRGYVYYENNLYCGKDFCMLVSSMAMSDIEREVKNFNGSFSFVKLQHDVVILAVDHVRSMPLFYALRDRDIYISDDAFWILKRLSNLQLDKASVEEFLFAGYVTGSQTLYKEIKQLQADQLVVVSLNKFGQFDVRTINYFSYLRTPEDQLPYDKETLLGKLDSVVLEVFKRAVMLLKDRTAVIPLSGGYDSRLVALTLKRLGYENVVCFSYGVPGNAESEISREVAKSLGYRWLFVEYSKDSWKKWYQSEAMRRYEVYASGLASLPHIQDWLAVEELSSNKLIPPDSVFMPGHTSVFAIAGLPVALPGKRSALRAILLRFYSLSYPRVSQKTLFEQKIKESLEASRINCKTFDGLVSFYHYWLWKELEAKFTVNSLRVYEFWGYDWLIPLWDAELAMFISRLPLEYLLKKKLYKEYVRNLCASMNVPEQSFAPSASALRTLIKNAEKFCNVFLPDFALRAIWMLKSKTIWKIRNERNHLAFFGMVDEKELKKGLYRHINSFLSRRFIELLASGFYQDLWESFGTDHEFKYLSVGGPRKDRSD